MTTTCSHTGASHLKAHAEAAEIDILECADIEKIVHLMCELGDDMQTNECPVLYTVVLSLHSFQPTGQDTNAIDYWQDKARDWFPEF